MIQEHHTKSNEIQNIVTFSPMIAQLRLLYCNEANPLQSLILLSIDRSVLPVTPGTDFFRERSANCLESIILTSSNLKIIYSVSFLKF